MDGPLNKKIFCLGACFLIFSEKNQKTGTQTLFYFAAEGGEILFTHPPQIPIVKDCLIRSRLSARARIFAFTSKQTQTQKW
jgi:hypothetical protein